MKPIKLLWHLQRGFPFGVVALFGFLEYAFSYEFCHKYVQPRSASIGLTVAFNVALVLIFGLWFTVLYNGPGFIECKIPPYDLDSFFKNGKEFIRSQQNGDSLKKSYKIIRHNELLSPPDMFLCNFQGLPGWCSICKSLKLMRVHHSSHCGRCVINMDHFCTFLGGVIGQNNYGQFLILITLIDLICLFSFISIAVYLKRSGNDVHPTVKISLIGCAVFFAMVLNLIRQNLVQIKHNETTIDQLAKGDIRKAYRRMKMKSVNETEHIKQITTYVNVKHPMIDGIRLIVPLTVRDYPYDTGSFIDNLKFRTSKEFVSLYQDVDSIVTTTKYMVSEKFSRDLLERISNHQIEATIFGNQDL